MCVLKGTLCLIHTVPLQWYSYNILCLSWHLKCKGWKIKFRPKRDKKGSIPAPVMLLCSPTWGGEFAHLCLVYMEHEVSLLASKAPFVKKKIYFQLVREHSAHIMCTLEKEPNIMMSIENSKQTSWRAAFGLNGWKQVYYYYFNVLQIL